jgi:hypothetical protein
MSDKPTREMILAEPAGRQMNAWVELFVMSGELKTMWTIETKDGTGIYDGPFDRESSAINALAKETWLHPVGAKVGNFQVAWNAYSRDIADAWQVVEKMHESGQYCGLWREGGDNSEWEIDIGVSLPELSAPTAPLAICRAALLSTLESESPCVYPTRQE